MIGSDSFFGISDYIPVESYQVLQNIDKGVNISFNDFYRLLIYKILTSKTEELGNILSATEGLENRVKKASTESVDMDSLIKAILSKRYTSTRISRLLAHILIGLDKETFPVYFGPTHWVREGAGFQ